MTVALTLAAAPAMAAAQSPTATDNLCTTGDHVAVTVTSGDAALDVDAEASARLYPERARRMQVEGDAGFRCASDGHRLVDCVVTSESRADLGFGRAALAVLQSVRVKGAAGGQPTARTVNGTAAFRITDPGRTAPCPYGR